MGTTPLDLVSVEDIGEIASIVFLNKVQYENKTISLCGAKLTIREIASEMSRQLRPLTFRDRPVSNYTKQFPFTYALFIPDLYKMIF